MFAYWLVNGGSSGFYVAKLGSFAISKGKSSVMEAVAGYISSHCLQGVGR